MITKYCKVSNSNKNMAIKTLPLSLISNEGEEVSNLNKRLATTLNSDNEFSDEEWLKAKHRLLDSRMEFRNRMKGISKPS
jgi:hypothetical protein